MIKKSIKNVSKLQFEADMKKADCKTMEDVLNLLYGEFSEFDYYSDYVVKYKYVDMPKGTFINRLNTLWVYPLFILAMPIRYLVYGDCKVNEDSMLGRIISSLIGELK